MVKRGRSVSARSDCEARQPQKEHGRKTRVIPFTRRQKNGISHPDSFGCSVLPLSGEGVNQSLQASKIVLRKSEMIYCIRKQTKNAKRRRKAKSMVSIRQDVSADHVIQGNCKVPSSKHVDSGFDNMKRCKRWQHRRRFPKARENSYHSVSKVNLDNHTCSGFHIRRKGTIMQKKQKKKVLNADSITHEDKNATGECFCDCIVHEDKDVTSNVPLDDVGSFNKESNCFLSLPERTVRIIFKKKLLVLDLNGILCDVVFGSQGSHMPHKRINKKSVYKRPFLDDFLAFCFEWFVVGVWSSRNWRNIIGVIDYIIGDAKDKLQFCWDSSKCTNTGFNTIENRHKPLVLKELSKLWNKEESSLPWEEGEYSQSNTLLVDDSPYKALLNPPHTAIFPPPFDFRDIDDCSLGPGGDIRTYLERIAVADDVQAHVMQHSFGQQALTSQDKRWSFYKNIIDMNSRVLIQS
ncbi:hypothetical protein HPP92_020452 [Vanilla planifolia]|uniref:Mitochondrial import inner membrane translocase subunit TIM50 n=1 Tax=Vanilla planifolia TaxID=51239 RepID=A0A835Q463_VANPL|nr:hypothetical protein HPP92_020452 [Vanilla planifolia]